ncbi:hypothetical protein BKA01_005441 [Pseudonocardia eucalypti]|nr:hypothetical protein [Pseudonocardia eucalypti]
MADEVVDTVVWRNTGGSGCLGCATGGLMVGALGMGAGYHFFGLSPNWAFGVLGLGLVGAVLGHLDDRRQPHTAFITRSQVRLTSRTRKRTRLTAELSVRVEHTGDTDEGYNRTTLTLRWPDDTVIMSNQHSPELGRRLGKLFGPDVRVDEEWRELEEPHGGA